MANRLTPDDKRMVADNAIAHFWRYGQVSGWLLVAVHTLMYGYYSFQSVYSLALINFSLALLFSWLVKTLHSSGSGIVLLIGALAVFANSLLSNFFLGWESGYFLQLICLLPVLILNISLNRIVISIILITSLISLVIMRAIEADKFLDITEDVVRQVGIINVFLVASWAAIFCAISAKSSLSLSYKLFEMSHRDSLTSLYNRRKVQSEVELISESATATTALVLLDVDNFKTINDVYGHEMGDVVLKRVSEILTKGLRATDVASRWGGEEFLILMRDTDLKTGCFVAERFRKRIQNMRCELDGRDIRVTATFAVGVLNDGERLDQAISRIDKALYEGKRSGKNRVMPA